MPTFDIIMPAYNAARFLPATLDSVIAQTFTDWRILLVDDGSTDGTAEVVDLYRERLGGKLEYIRQKNAGPSAARNTAIRHASAEYLALLDADDVWLPQRLQRAFERFQACPQAALTYGFNSRIDPDGKLIDTFDQPKPNGEGKVARFLYMRTLDMNCPTVSFRRSCVDEVGGFDETFRASEDRDLWIRIAIRHEVAMIPEVIALYRMSPHSNSTNVERMTDSQLRLIEKHYGAPGCGWLARRIALSRVYRERAESMADKGQLSAAVSNSFKALSYLPFHFRTLRTTASLLLRYSLGKRAPVSRPAL